MRNLRVVLSAVSVAVPRGEEMPKFMSALVVGVTLLAILLTACSDEPNPTETATPTSAPTNTSVPTPEPTATPVPTPEPTATPAPTPEPTATPEPAIGPISMPDTAEDPSAIRMIAAGGTTVVLQSLKVIPSTRQGSRVEFEWSQVSGAPVELMNADTEYASFSAPAVEDDTTLVFSVNADYGGGVTASDTLSIRIVPGKTEKVLAALVDFLDVDPADRPFTRDDIVDLLIDNPDSLRSFISHTSRGLVSVDFDVLDWVTVNKGRTDFSIFTGSPKFVAVPDAVSRMSDFVDLSEYDKVMPFIFPVEQGYPGCAANLDESHWGTPNGSFNLGAAWLSGYDMSCVKKGRIAHEFGHTLGLVHSYAIDCEKTPPIPGSTIDPTDMNDSCYLNLCTNGDCTKASPADAHVIANSDFDMLGGDQDYRYEDFFPVHFHATWQALAGWLTEYQVLDASSSGEYWLTTLESLTPTPKAMKIFLGNDHRGDPQYYWFQTREFSPCKVDVRLQASNIRSRTIPFDTYYMRNDRATGGKGGTFDADTAFHDVHRGIRVDVLGCESGEPGSAVRLKVSFSGLDVDPEIVAVFDTQETHTITLTNSDSVPIDVGSISLGGRHPAAFAIGSDDCSDGLLEPGSSCMVAVRYTLSGSQTDTHGLLKIPNSDGLAPDMTVSLFRTGDPGSLPDRCVQNISPGSASGSWNTDCVSATWPPSYNARFYTFSLEAKANVNIGFDSEEIPKIFIYSTEDVGGAVLAESPEDSGRIENLTLQPGAYTIEVTTIYSGITADFVLTLDVENQ